MDRLKAELARAGLAPADLPAALLVHELLGAAMATAFWAACYAVQPSNTALGPVARRLAARHPAAQRLWERSVASAAARVRRTPWLAARGADPGRLTLSLAESLVLRATIKPATFVFKLWASAAVVKGGKVMMVAGRGGGGGRGARVGCVTLTAFREGGGLGARAVRRVCPWREWGAGVRDSGSECVC